MDSPIPTPFDIIDPSAGALTPTPLAWAILILTAGCSALLISALIGSNRRANKLSKTLKRLFNELCDTSNLITANTQPYPTDLIERAARITRRILTPVTDVDTGGMSCAELREMAHQLSSFKGDYKADELSCAVSNALNLLANLEELTYAPHDNTSIKNVSELLNNLIQHLGVAIKTKRALTIAKRNDAPIQQMSQSSTLPPIKERIY
jgi:hypothetical protein